MLHVKLILGRRMMLASDSFCSTQHESPIQEGQNDAKNLKISYANQHAVAPASWSGAVVSCRWARQARSR